MNIFLKDHHVPAAFTVLNFVVEDMAKTMEALSEKGITFEHYDGEDDVEAALSIGAGFGYSLEL